MKCVVLLGVFKLEFLKHCIHSLSTLLDTPAGVVAPPCRCKVRDNSSSSAAQFVFLWSFFSENRTLSTGHCWLVHYSQSSSSIALSVLTHTH